MKPKHLIVAFSAAALCASVNSCNSKSTKTDRKDVQPVAGTEKFSDTATSTVRVFDNEGRVCIQQTNTYYEMADAYEGPNRIPILIKITKTDLCYSDSVNKDKVYEITVRSLMDTKQVEWSTRFVATHLVFNDKTNTLLAIHEGSDSEEDMLRRYSLINGSEVFSCSYSDMKVSIPNVKDKRFIGFTSRKATGQPIQKNGEENVIGLITYASSTGTKDRIKLKLKRSKVAAMVPAYTPEMRLEGKTASTAVIEDGKGLILMKADEKTGSEAVKDFSAVFTFYIGEDNEATSITIPVKNDRLQLSEAGYDKELFELIP